MPMVVVAMLPGHQGLVIYFLDPPVLDLDFTQLASMAELELSATRWNMVELELGGRMGPMDVMSYHDAMKCRTCL